MTSKVLISLDDAQAIFTDLWAGEDEPVLRKVRRNLTYAEVRALSSAPIELLPGEPGKALWPIAGVVLYRPGDTPYLSGAGYLEIGAAANVVYLIASLDVLFTATVDSLMSLYRAEDFPGTPLPLAQCEGQPLMAWAEVDPADGDGTLVIGLIYRVMTP